MREKATYVLPRDKGAAPLDLVIAVMAFLAALALGASLVAARAAHGWQSGLADRITVQVMPPEDGGTRAGLDRHQELVALRPQMGSLPGFIARAVECHFFVSALFAARLGTLCAALFFLGAGGLEVFGVEALLFLQSEEHSSELQSLT